MKKPKINRAGQRLTIFSWHTRWFWITMDYDPYVYEDAWLKIEFFSTSHEKRYRHWQWWRWREKDNYQPWWL